MEQQLEDVWHQVQHVHHIQEHFLHVLTFKNQIKYALKQLDSAEHWFAQTKHHLQQQIHPFLKELSAKESLILMEILARWVVGLHVFHLQLLHVHHL